MNALLVLGLLVASAIAVPMKDAGGVQLNRDLDCIEEENSLFSCVFAKAVSTLDRAARSSDIEIFDGVKFVRETPLERSGKSMKTEADIMNELPHDTADRAIKLVSMLYESALSFAKSHSLKLSMPEEGSISRALVEGRGKIKKMVLPLIAAAGVKLFALVPILFGSLSLLVLKALFVGKAALLIAGILAFQKLFSGSSVGSTASNFFSKNAQPAGTWFDGANPAWSAGAASSGQSQGYYKRSFDVADGKLDAHSMAYAAQAPIVNETN